MKAKQFIYGTLTFAVVFCSTGFLAVAEETGKSIGYQKEVDADEMSFASNSEHRGLKLQKHLTGTGTHSGMPHGKWVTRG